MSLRLLLGWVVNTVVLSNTRIHLHSAPWVARKPSEPFFAFWLCSSNGTLRHLPDCPTLLRLQVKGTSYTALFAHWTYWFRWLILHSLGGFLTELFLAQNCDNLFGAENATETPALWPIFFKLCEILCKYGITATFLLVAVWESVHVVVTFNGKRLFQCHLCPMNFTQHNTLMRDLAIYRSVAVLPDDARTCSECNSTMSQCTRRWLLVCCILLLRFSSRKAGCSHQQAKEKCQLSPQSLIILSQEICTTLTHFNGFKLFSGVIIYLTFHTDTCLCGGS